MDNCFITRLKVLIFFAGITYMLLSCKKESDQLPIIGSVIDIEDNFYKTVKINSKYWMAENLKTTKFNDGAEIPLVTIDYRWRGTTAPAYSWYSNDSIENKATYGALYNWYAVNSGRLCPTGWHVPTDEEWTSLTDYYGGELVAGGKLKEAGVDSHWNGTNSKATNESGFTALPGGLRTEIYGNFGNLRDIGYWWTSTAESTTLAYIRIIYSSKLLMNNFDIVESESINMKSGLSVRCVQD